jgi:hypothetical protein
MVVALVLCAQGVTARLLSGEVAHNIAQKAKAKDPKMEYSPIRIEIIRIRRSWFLWSIAIAFGFGLIYGTFGASEKGTVFGSFVGLLAMVGLWLPMYCLYKLSMAVEPNPAVAWSKLAWQIVPFFGLVVAFSLVSKAGRVVKDRPNLGPVQNATLAD